MKFLVAPDKFKGSLSAVEAADCIATGICRALPEAEIDLCPIADGGEGTVATMLAACGGGGRLLSRRVTGPLPEMQVDASFAMLDDGTAVIEMAAASGLTLLAPADRNPLNTTTFGTGELITAAVREGAKRIILGLGGSATIDAGIGCAQACGFTILTRDGEPISMSEPLCGRDLANVLMVKHGRGELAAGIEIVAAADVDNPLLGPNGAARVFGPQKGASPAAIELLEQHLLDLVNRTGTQADAAHPGAGAAGGLGFGILSFFRGTIVSGFQLIAQHCKLAGRLEGVDLCFTGEGRLDAQTPGGKSVAGVAQMCAKQRVPCVALVGSVAQNAPAIPGLTATFSIADGPMSLEESQRRSHHLLTEAASNCTRIFAAK